MNQLKLVFQLVVDLLIHVFPIKCVLKHCGENKYSLHTHVIKNNFRTGFRSPAGVKKRMNSKKG